MLKPITVAETQLFIRQANAVWANDERAEFIDFIASNPEAGNVIHNTGGVRRIRWGRQGSGKRGGVRVIYFYYGERAALFVDGLRQSPTRRFVARSQADGNRFNGDPEREIPQVKGGKCPNLKKT